MSSERSAALVRESYPSSAVGRSVSPKPRRSGATTVKLSVNNGINLYQ
jgi:hypothetical protein